MAGLDAETKYCPAGISTALCVVKGECGKIPHQLKEGLFVPPVIIGSFKKNASNDNIILDGQQRLTSVLLGYLGIYPKFDEFKEPVLSLFHDGEDAIDDGVEEIIAWTFNQLLDENMFIWSGLILSGTLIWQSTRL